MIKQKLSAAKEIQSKTQDCSIANGLAAEHQLLMRMDHDPVEETTTFYFKDGSILIIEPHLIEAES